MFFPENDGGRYRAKSRPMPHEKTLKQFTNGGPVVPHDRLPDFAKEQLVKVPKVLRQLAVELKKALDSGEDAMSFRGDDDARIQTLEPEHPDLRAFVVSSWLVLLSDDLSEFIGGIGGGMTWIEESHRGKGYGTEMLLTVERADRNLHILAPGFFSEGGYATRKAAHRQACQEAHDAGQTLHPENYGAYGIEVVRGVDNQRVTAALVKHFADLLRDDESTRMEVAEERFAKLNAIEIIEVARETLGADALEDLGFEDVRDLAPQFPAAG
ncbi:hypothetical protein [Salipiger sp. PrR003]|uniref:hypothetical protein n=1 Tax=Salipiger sp. PrR003 TaxID=2706776 RepID=UPI0013DC2415|nr:hypothetical protein [Salipiger sp. PrR003]NDV50417.1 hypothetical protein [Salipiger sp. PrR003]